MKSVNTFFLLLQKQIENHNILFDSEINRALNELNFRSLLNRSDINKKNTEFKCLIWPVPLNMHLSLFLHQDFSYSPCVYMVADNRARIPFPPFLLQCFYRFVVLRKTGLWDQIDLQQEYLSTMKGA